MTGPNHHINISAYGLRHSGRVFRMRHWRGHCGNAHAAQEMLISGHDSGRCRCRPRQPRLLNPINLAVIQLWQVSQIMRRAQQNKAGSLPPGACCSFTSFTLSPLIMRRAAAWCIGEGLLAACYVCTSPNEGESRSLSPLTLWTATLVLLLRMLASRSSCDKWSVLESSLFPPAARAAVHLCTTCVLGLIIMCYYFSAAVCV